MPKRIEFSVDEVSNAAKQSKSIAGVVRILYGEYVRKNNYRGIRNFIIRHKIDISHFKPREYARRGEFPIESYLRKNQKVGGSFRRRLLNSGLLGNRCKNCGLGFSWNGEDLSLQIDHVNGDNMDNRIENLRLLCPNCHSQTSTFTNKKRN